MFLLFTMNISNTNNRLDNKITLSPKGFFRQIILCYHNAIDGQLRIENKRIENYLSDYSIILTLVGIKQFNVAGGRVVDVIIEYQDTMRSRS